MKKLFIFWGFVLITALAAQTPETIYFPSKDGLTITADLYQAHPDTAPFIVLYHQAGFSRGEYREIAPKLNQLGFNCLAIDQRSGKGVRGVLNETARRAKQAGKPSSYLNTLPDLLSAVDYARQHFAKGKLLLWGSSYSAALVLKIAGDFPGIADGVLAFSPGEYFVREGKSNQFITRSARNITIPVFITSAKKEKELWWSIYRAIPSRKKTYFLPETAGVHGSRALWKSTPESPRYWEAVREFLTQFNPGLRLNR